MRVFWRFVSVLGLVTFVLALMMLAVLADNLVWLQSIGWTQSTALWGIGCCVTAFVAGLFMFVYGLDKT